LSTKRPAQFEIKTQAGRTRATLSGNWTARFLGEAAGGLVKGLRGAPGVDLDMTEVGRMDTAGAFAVIRAVGPGFDISKITARAETHRLLELVANAVKAPAPPARRPEGLHELMIRTGKGVMELGREIFDTMVFLGHLLVVVALTLYTVVTKPRIIRWAALFSAMERSGLDAIPIVAVTTFFIGAVVGFIGADMLQQFGAEVFSVELVGIAMLREFNIIITAVLLAGRSGSAFAAEIGAMKMNQEIDAMQVLGVDPFEALVAPRFFALLFTIPLLTFVATMAGLFGGMMVIWTFLDLGPSFFLQRLMDNVGAQHMWVGLSKAPVMAAVIAGIGCRQGLEVGGDVESLGRRVTASVVHAIFAIIMIDAAFALLYMQLDI
jgi:phospholipid/cholesterol/gamma-HCH transport system permease protein